MDASIQAKILIEKIDEYIAGTLTAEDLSRWAQDIITSNDHEAFSPKIRETIHALFDLHDIGESWCPAKEELLQYKQLLEEEIK